MKLGEKIQLTPNDSGISSTKKKPTADIIIKGEKFLIPTPKLQTK